MFVGCFFLGGGSSISGMRLQRSGAETGLRGSALTHPTVEGSVQA